jgi:D-aspartate ligase
MKNRQNNLEFQPVIIGADVGAYSIARSFHEQYSISSIIVCKGRIMPTAYSRI